MWRIRSFNDQYPWVNRDLPNNVQGSVLSADLPNTLVDELCNLVEGSGMTLDKTSTSQVLEAVRRVAVESIYPVGVVYTQYQDPSTDNFNSDHEPQNFFDWGGVWTPIFDADGVVFSTPGSMRNEFRSGGIQTDAMQRLTGNGALTDENTTRPSGVFGKFDVLATAGSNTPGAQISFDNARQARTSSETRMRNRLVRKWRLTAYTWEG